MVKRGWSNKLIHETINNPFTKRVSNNKATGNIATVYYQRSGAYVVKDDITNEVIQISDRLDHDWLPDPSIINPYIP